MEIKEAVNLYLNYLKVIGRSDYTIRSVRYHLFRFMNFLQGEGISEIDGLKPKMIAGYQEELCWRMSKKGDLLKKSTQALSLVIVKGFCRWLTEEDYFVSDPTVGIHLPKVPRRLPRDILEVREMARLLSKPDVQGVRGYRDRLIMEILYSTGIRLSECSNLKVEDVDYENGYLRINGGKGDKDRVVPLGKIAGELCGNYLKSIRPEIVEKWRDGKVSLPGSGKDEGYLILNRFGKKLVPMGIYKVVKKYVGMSRQKQGTSPHSFRRSCATHMLQRGANIRHLQEMLGHSNINSTQVYLKLTINDLKKAHAKYHPREKKESGSD